MLARAPLGRHTHGEKLKSFFNLHCWCAALTTTPFTFKMARCTRPAAGLVASCSVGEWRLGVGVVDWPGLTSRRLLSTDVKKDAWKLASPLSTVEQSRAHQPNYWKLSSVLWLLSVQATGVTVSALLSFSLLHISVGNLLLAKLVVCYPDN